MMPAHPRRWLDLPDAPAIPGLRFRTYAARPDIGPLRDLLRAVNRVDGDTQEWTYDELRLGLEEWTHVDPREDRLLAFVGEQLVAGSNIDWLDSNDGRRFYQSVGHVHPEWRRRGIGAAMMQRNEQRLAELAASHDGSRAPVLTTCFEATDTGARALAHLRGYRRARVYHHMTRPHLDGIVLPPLPDGLAVRPVTAETLPRLWDAIMEAFRDHFGGEDDSPAAFRRWSGDPNLDLSLAVIAFDGDEIAGGVLGYDMPEENEAQGYRRGWADPVFTRRRWRRRGLASALIGLTLARLRDRGMTSAQLDVDSENPNQALGLYERHGFVVDRSSEEWHKPLAA